MARSLVIVESPAKAGTLGKFLGKDFRVAACYGHVRDLDRKGLAVDRAKGYEPQYRIVPGKERTVAELARVGIKLILYPLSAFRAMSKQGTLGGPVAGPGPGGLSKTVEGSV